MNEIPAWVKGYVDVGNYLASPESFKNPETGVFDEERVSMVLCACLDNVVAYGGVPGEISCAGAIEEPQRAVIEDLLAISRGQDATQLTSAVLPATYESQNRMCCGILSNLFPRRRMKTFSDIPEYLRSEEAFNADPEVHLYDGVIVGTIIDTCLQALWEEGTEPQIIYVAIHLSEHQVASLTRIASYRDK